MQDDVTARGTASPTDRLRKGKLALLRQAAGSPGAMWHKMGRLLSALAAYRDVEQLDARLAELQRLGHIEQIPNRVQLVVGAYDMLRFWIVPAAEDYYGAKGIHFGFHQVLRFLDEPASLVDPTGFMSTADNIIGHVMQVVHANPCYDLQLLESYPGGLDELERQVQQMLDGTHPRAASIGAIVEEPDYHQRLLGYLREYRKSRDAVALVRTNVEANPKLAELETVFGTLPGAMRYFARLPDTPRAALRHARTVKEFPTHLVRSPE